MIEWEDLPEIFEKNENEFSMSSDDKVINRFHRRNDLCAMLILERLCPGDTDIISGTGHDKIWFAIKGEQAVKSATMDDLLDLIRLGVCYDVDCDRFWMFV